jgi:S1-C subfamily serine protease
MKGYGRGPACVIVVTIVCLASTPAYGRVDAGHEKAFEEEPIVQVYKKVAPATVFITSAYASQHHLMSGQGNGIGSGMLLDREGSVLTNAHVVEGASKIMVVLHDGTRLPADLVGSDKISDIALLHVQLPEGEHDVARLGDSDHLQIGQRVLAIGHPFGLGYALTTGVVSGFGTTLAGIARDRMIQTSAAMNPGNSGGPLVDLEGRIVGVNNAILVGAQNISFAIPINTVKAVVSELQSHGRVIRPWLGITGTWLPDEVKDVFALPLAQGLLVEDVEEGSPAEKAGLRSGMLSVTIEREPWLLGGDIITTINNVRIKTPEQCSEIFKALTVGQTVQFTVLRDGRFRDIDLILEERPRPSSTTAKPKEKLLLPSNVTGTRLLAPLHFQY